ncbi:MAG: JDVT-CTERM system CAAX-type protease [Proteobacteria bacterium]|nr:JDVT-CTERM system CAAX-type protease [Pseudomonadota bacterium]
MVTPASTPEMADLWSRRFIVVAIIFPIFEEIVFRGVLQGWMLKKSWGGRKKFGISSANVAVSIVFTALHVVRRVGVISVGVFVPSLVFGYFRERYDNLTASIGLHIFYNSGFVLLFS